jgi:hypothetical protein
VHRNIWIGDVAVTVEGSTRGYKFVIRQRLDAGSQLIGCRHEHRFECDDRSGVGFTAVFLAILTTRIAYDFRVLGESGSC